MDIIRAPARLNLIGELPMTHIYMKELRLGNYSPVFSFEGNGFLKAYLAIDKAITGGLLRAQLSQTDDRFWWKTSENNINCFVQVVKAGKLLIIINGKLGNPSVKEVNAAIESCWEVVKSRVLTYTNQKSSPVDSFKNLGLDILKVEYTGDPGV